MATTVVDTTVLLARVDEDDPRHDVARAIVDGLDRGELPTARVTNYVVLETLNWIHARRRHDLAVEAYDRLAASAGFEVVDCASRDFTRALELFESHEGLAFGDATTVAYMERTGLEYLYAFDDDFDGVAAVTRLETADDSFGPG